MKNTLSQTALQTTGQSPFRSDKDASYLNGCIGQSSLIGRPLERFGIIDSTLFDTSKLEVSNWMFQLWKNFKVLRVYIRLGGH